MKWKSILIGRREKFTRYLVKKEDKCLTCISSGSLFYSAEKTWLQKSVYFLFIQCTFFANTISFTSSETWVSWFCLKLYFPFCVNCCCLPSSAAISFHSFPGLLRKLGVSKGRLFSISVHREMGGSFGARLTVEQLKYCKFIFNLLMVLFQ